MGMVLTEDDFRDVCVAVDQASSSSGIAGGLIIRIETSLTSSSNFARQNQSTMQVDAVQICSHARLIFPSCTLTLSIV